MSKPLQNARTNVVQRLSRLTRATSTKSRENLQNLARSPFRRSKNRGKGEVLSSGYVGSNISTIAQSQSENQKTTAPVVPEAFQENLENSKNVQRLVNRFMKQENNLKFIIRKKKRKVGRQMLKRAYDHDRIYKVGVLRKQGGRIKTWKSRYFVLRQKLLFYFESQEAFEEGLPPKGWLFLREMNPNKQGYVCTPSTGLRNAILPKTNIFTIQTEKRTYVISAKSKEQRMSWMKTIQEAYEDFWKGYNLPIPVAKATKELGKGQRTLEDLLPIAEKLDTYDELEENEIEDATRLLMLAECIVRWKTFVKVRKLYRELGVADKDE